MQTKTSTALPSLAIARFIVLLNSLMNILPGLALLFAPKWFYQIADFPPFNQHFMGDAGAFSLALGIGLLVAARNPNGHRSLIAVAALAGLIHVGNHLYDDLIIQQGTTPHLVTNTLPLLILPLLLIPAYFLARPATT
jgi:hypothetical protein